MAKEKQVECPPPGAPAWMASYGDIMTLCLCFFVLLFAMSTIDAEKLEAVSKAMSSLFSINSGGSTSPAISINSLTGNGLMQLPESGTGIQQTVSPEQIDSQAELVKMASDFKTYFAEQNIAERVSLDNSNIEQGDYIEITFDNAMMFDLGKADLKPAAMEVLAVLVAELEKYPNNDVRIEGHTDDIPISTAQFPSNWELSAARAISVAKFMVNAQGFPPSRISTEGFGEFRPEFPNDSAENRAKNRRVVMKVKGTLTSQV